MNINKIKELLAENDMFAKKKYGQNFLVDDNILKIIAKSLNGGENVVEIGPGLGSLTEYLLKEYKEVLAYEIDEDMVDVLKTRFDEHLIIKNEDFLKANIDQDLTSQFNATRIDLIANLPYYITTPIILKILEESKIIKQMTIMVQKEVGDRILGKVSTKEYNSLSVLIQTYMDVSKLINVPRNAFYPEPNVDSVVLVLKRKARLDYEILNEELFKKVNRLLFSQRRKTIVNNLKNIYNKDKILVMLKDLNLKDTSRSEELTIEQIVNIANYIERNGLND